MRKNKLIAGIITVSIFLTGCVDRVEIDRRNIISILGIDIGKEIVKEKEIAEKIDPSDPFAQKEIKKLKITYGFPDVSSLGESKGTQTKVLYFTSEAYSMEDAMVKNTSKSSRKLNYGMERALVISQDIFKYEDTFREVLDYISRNSSINKSMYVIACEGRAEDYIKYKPNAEANLENFISGLMENTQENASIVAVKLNDFITTLDKNGNAILPRIQYDVTKDEVNLTGSILIKDYKVVEELNDLESGVIKLLKGGSGSISKVIYYKGHPLDFTIKKSKTKIRTNTDNPDKLVFDLKLTMEGDISGYYYHDKLEDPNLISDIEKNFNEAIGKECARIMKFKLQDKAVDFVGLSDSVEAFHNPTWIKIKENWDEVYKNSEINISVDTKIKRIGLAK